MSNVASKEEHDPIDPRLVDDVDWFAGVTRTHMGDLLDSLTVYGPAVSEIYNSREHRIHFLIVMTRRDVDALLRLAAEHKAATRRNIAPPLVTTVDAIAGSHDVFPLEWIDIAQYHQTVHGKLRLQVESFRPTDVRLQCERDLRSLDIQLQRGILASGGNVKRIDRLEREAADTLVRVLRGICFLEGEIQERLPAEVADRAASISGIDLAGCKQAIIVGGRHDLSTCRSMVLEIAALAAWMNDWRPTDRTPSSSRDGDSPAPPDPA